ncbi:MAG: 2-oxoacid:acceptor oxidoreductase subunit alpha [Deltaproteobacteria bacterium]|nr:2-oxoacid:acceptor oxidoreductase subunit alpha [Deltaproteobacteria bacterium]
MAPSELTFGIVGSGGDGVLTAGNLLVQSAARDGLYCFMVKSFGPQIRGGESSCRIRVSDEQVLSQGDKLDVLAAFNWNDVVRFQTEIRLTDDAVVLVDEAEEGEPPEAVEGRRIVKVPISAISQEQIGAVRSKNMVMIGVLAEACHLPIEGVRRSVEKKLGRKGPDVVAKNLAAIEAGRSYAKENLADVPIATLEYEPSEPKILMTGNEAVAYGAIYAGCRFYAGYPITPATEILQYLAREMPRFGGVVVQAEDEISAMGMVIGASFAGKKAMTATSGPGMSLKTEGIGLACLAEIPSVIVNVQRAGPSTGIPTKTEQADLQQAIYGTHGDAPRVVVAPSDVEDCFDVTVESFYIAEKYQIPVIILSDQFVGQRIESVNRDGLLSVSGFTAVNKRRKPHRDELDDYKRFKDTPSGVSPMTWPGIEGGQYATAGIVHDENGDPSSVMEVHWKMAGKRSRKFEDISKELQFIRHYGPEDAEIGLIGWGSSKGAIKESVLRANAEGYKVQAVIPQIIYPLPQEKIAAFLAPLKKLVVCEVSFSGQFLHYLRSLLDLPKETYSVSRPGGMPLAIAEIYDRLMEIM